MYINIYKKTLFTRFSMRNNDIKSGQLAYDSVGSDAVDFDFIEEDRGSYIKLCPKGCINTATVKFMKKRLYDLSCENNCKIMLSLKDVKSIDSVGLGTIITAHKNCAHCGGVMVLSELPLMISKTMKMLSMDKYLKMTSDDKEAESLLGC